MDAALGFLLGLPRPVLYAVLAVGSATENLLPPVPADTFILLGGFLAGRGRLDAWSVFGVTWAANVTSALAVYWIGHRYGRSFFEIGMGRRILHEGQLARMQGFYRRWGTHAIFLTRFLPGFRAVVPVFAGVSHQPPHKVALPLAAASAIWYGILVWLGATTARNLETLLAWLGGINRVFLVLALALAGLVAAWWWKTRHGGGGDEAGEGTDGGGSGG
jgi:membrane protein DedA with SNARE-associated domain